MTLAMTIEPGRPGTAQLTTFQGPVGEGDVLVEGIAVGICGTDAEIAAGLYGTAPDGADVLVLGHESLGRVVAAPTESGLAAGDLVAGIVRRPDPVPCRACAAGAWDMCLNGRYTERGIKGLHGYGAEQWRVESGFVVRVDPSLGLLGVLVEPCSVVSKAWEHIGAVMSRAPLAPVRVLVTGAGPIGLLAAMLGAERGLDVHVLDRLETGPKPDLVVDLGATYHTDFDRVPQPDVVIECTGADAVVVEVLRRTTPAGVVCLTGVSSGGRLVSLDVGALNRSLVLENDVVLGSVNANRAHYEAAVRALSRAERAWLSQLVTRTVPLDRWSAALERHPDDVKVVVDLAGGGGAIR